MQNLRRTMVALLCLQIFVIGQPSEGQDFSDMRKAMEWFQSRCPSHTQEVAGEMSKGLTEAERQTLAGIKLECVRDAGFGAVAFEDHGQPKIRIAVGTLVSLEAVSTAGALSATYGKPLCGALYMQRWAELGKENTERLFRGEPPRRGESPYEFAQENPQYCPKVSESQFRANSQAADYREMLINGGLRFILAHEMGHHVLGHLRSRPTSAAESRTREREADLFALRVVGKAGYSPLDAIMALGLLAAFDDYSQRNPTEASHPAGAARLGELGAAMKELEGRADFRDYFREDPSRRHTWRMAMQAFESMKEGLE